MIASLSRLEACHLHLIAALDRNDVEGIIDSVAEFRDTVEEIGTIGVWLETPKAVELVSRIQRLSEAARIRVNFLTDLNRQRIEALAAARGRAMIATYQSDGSQVA